MLYRDMLRGWAAYKEIGLDTALARIGKTKPNMVEVVPGLLEDSTGKAECEEVCEKAGIGMRELGRMAMIGMFFLTPDGENKRDYVRLLERCAAIENWKLMIAPTGANFTGEWNASFLKVSEYRAEHPETAFGWTDIDWKEAAWCEYVSAGDHIAVPFGDMLNWYMAYKGLSSGSIEELELYLTIKEGKGLEDPL